MSTSSKSQESTDNKEASAAEAVQADGKHSTAEEILEQHDLPHEPHLSPDAMQKQPAEEELENPGVVKEAMLFGQSIRPLMQYDVNEVRATLWDRIERWLTHMTIKYSWVEAITSRIFIPYRAKCGLQLVKEDGQDYTYRLPFKHFNKNMYGAVAGAALLGNCEVAGGMAAFRICGGEYAVVCKELNAKFRRPSFSSVLFEFSAEEDVAALAATKGEFDIHVNIKLFEEKSKKVKKTRRIGTCKAIFHAIPKSHMRYKSNRKANA